jgi:hypothetical protein
MPRVVRNWEVDERGEFYSYSDPYPAQCEAEGELSAAQANVITFTPYLRSVHRRWYAVRADLVEYLRR